MRYTYYVYSSDGCRKEITTTISKVDVTEGGWVVARDNLSNKLTIFGTEEEFLGFCTGLEREIWLDKDAHKVCAEKVLDNLVAKQEDGFSFAVDKEHMTDKSVITGGYLGDGLLSTKTIPMPNGGSVIVKEKKKDAVNPSHYQGYVDELQWLDVMSKIPQFRDPEKFKAAILLQIHKYLSRLDRKDSGLQECEKMRWYTTYLIEFMRNGDKPVLIKDIAKLKD